METHAAYMERLRQIQADQKLELRRSELLGQIVKEPHRRDDERESIELGTFALNYLFSHDAETGFLQEHVHKETRLPSSLQSIDQIKQFWLSRMGKDALATTRERDPKNHIDLDSHCQRIEHMAAEYDPSSEEYQVLELIARALIYLELHGYSPELLAHCERVREDPQKEYEADFRRLFFKRTGRVLPP